MPGIRNLGFSGTMRKRKCNEGSIQKQHCKLSSAIEAERENTLPLFFKVMGCGSVFVSAGLRS